MYVVMCLCTVKREREREGGSLVWVWKYLANCQLLVIRYLVMIKRKHQRDTFFVYFVTDVKMDWCNTKGVNLDPHVAYGNMVSVLTRGFICGIRPPQIL